MNREAFKTVNVVSSNVAAIGFNPDTSQGLVEFQNGSVYVYDGCTSDEATAIATAKSVGRAFNDTWRGTKPYARIAS